MAEDIIFHTVFLVTCIVAVGVCLVYIFSREKRHLRRGGAGVNSYEKFLLDSALVVLIIVLIWMGVRRRRNNNNGDLLD